MTKGISRVIDFLTFKKSDLNDVDSFFKYNLESIDIMAKMVCKHRKFKSFNISFNHILCDENFLSNIEMKI